MNHIWVALSIIFRWRNASEYAIALIGNLPDTIKDRSIPIRLKRKTAAEKVAKMPTGFDDANYDLKRKIKRWVIDKAEFLKCNSPLIPETGNDRAEDNWTSLLTIAECAGGEWSERARSSMVGLLESLSEDSIRQMLLKDILGILKERDKISSKELTDELVGLGDRPWGDWRRGKPLTQNGLAKLLNPFGISSKTIRIDNGTAKGYTSEQFEDTFKRYLSAFTPFQSVTPSQPTPAKELPRFQNVTEATNVTLEKHGEPLPVKECDGVTVENGVLAEKKQEEVSDYVSV